ncbi:MAG: HIT family protein [Planctomycetota bacterium]|nr:HIT family protein [Planctomycetota bacterium]
MPSVFTRILAGEIPGQFVFRDELWFAILDIRPVAPGHCLLIPTVETALLAELPSPQLAALGDRLARLTRAVKAASGAAAVNILVNDGPDAGQEVPHAHLHIWPRFPGDGKRLGWPAAPYGAGELEQWGGRLRAAWR